MEVIELTLLRNENNWIKGIASPLEWLQQFNIHTFPYRLNMAQF